MALFNINNLINHHTFYSRNIHTNILFRFKIIIIIQQLIINSYTLFS